jgi:hypothetical protein
MAKYMSAVNIVVQIDDLRKCLMRGASCGRKINDAACAVLILEILRVGEENSFSRRTHSRGELSCLRQLGFPFNLVSCGRDFLRNLSEYVPQKNIKKLYSSWKLES